ncbi:MAG: N-acetylmuramic acid 6-phosphate etherase [Cyclobacteriaceae bacterium]|nr:N-acetylmuramic acid 6-phosphate etherase [Cyclobacteriaceae bacterium]MCB0498913.1 N-acetylmuramic acid 6-phosphate etherase [Cyclobacteriaceae bacterium]MCB9237573.1 N-acetylmuramic acid 6-phosphate etherase [Flammeovirgaceae bacterium]MCO5270325.1 N-acetylmuramic acid 6-phosphate etherase [Cyclobacteriaceae bacterium]MCW5902301.1 N-acetylmuramic acid 6-phosphate etherase [Cyclobacteriaceae bacterium]
MLGTESSSKYDNLEGMGLRDLLVNINHEDQSVPLAVQKKIPEIEKLVTVIVEKMQKGGRLFYIGAGTSGRLGILDASEIPPTYGLLQDRVIGLIAGGDQAIRRAVEHAEDDIDQAWRDLLEHRITEADVLIGIAASGRTPYVIGGVRTARKKGVVTGCITCNEGSVLARLVDHPIEVAVGPEFVTGSTRMKAGTAQKLVLNMISTATMIQLGRIKGNRMVDMQLSNDKLIERGIRIIMLELGVDEERAVALLKRYGNVRVAIERMR